MKALSLTQPMAWAIFHGKLVENRQWNTYHGRVYSMGDLLEMIKDEKKEVITMASKGYRTSGGTIGRIFDGKKYLLTRQVSTKSEANTIRNSMKKMGWLVRIVHKPKATYPYHIYKRSRRSR